MLLPLGYLRCREACCVSNIGPFFRAGVGAFFILPYVVLPTVLCEEFLGNVVVERGEGPMVSGVLPLLRVNGEKSKLGAIDPGRAPGTALELLG